MGDHGVGCGSRVKRVVEDTPRPIPEIIPEVPPRLCEIIARLHAKDPDDRFDSAREVADLLSRCLTDLQQHGQVQPVAGVAPPAVPKPSAAGLRRRLGPWAVALLLASLIALSFSEANGVTDLHGTVIRLFSPEGTLVVEADDPGVSVAVDGEDLVITGAVAREIRLKTGRHTVQARKDGKVVQQELVSITSQGSQVVQVRREVTPGSAAAAREESAVAVIGEGPVRTVAARLKELNPDFQGEIRSDRIDHLRIVGSGIRDISPIRAGPQLQYLNCMVKTLKDLAPLTGMHLADLSVQGSAVSDLTPLKGMELSHFVCTATPVSDLWPLKGMPLRDLQIAYTAVVDLSPLKDMKLQWLNCDGCKGVSDLSPLKGMPLTKLNLRDTRVSDLAPLKGMRLTHFDYTNSFVTDMSPLKGMPLKEVRCDFQPERDAAILRSIRTLETINGRPAVEFWKDVD
jgi:eukaryotic-like serine/threonine-protein kinase